MNIDSSHIEAMIRKAGYSYLLRDKWDKEDLIQDVHLTLLQKKSLYNKDYSVGTFIKLAIKDVLQERARQYNTKKRTGETFSPDTGYLEEMGSYVDNTAELSILLEQVKAKMPPEVACYFTNPPLGGKCGYKGSVGGSSLMTAQKVGEIYGISRQAVDKAIHKYRKEIRGYL